MREMERILFLGRKILHAINLQVAVSSVILSGNFHIFSRKGFLTFAAGEILGGKREYGPFLIDRAADERTPLFPHYLSHSFPKLAHSTINHGGKEKGSFRKRPKNFFVSSPPFDGH